MIANGAIGVSWVRIGPISGRPFEFRPRHRREAADLSADRGTAEIGGEAKSQGPHGNATADLIGRAAEAEREMDQRQKDAGKGSGGKPEHRASGLGGDRKAGAGAAQHLAFDAEVHDADTLGQRLAKRHHHQRCRRTQHGRGP